MHRFLLDLRTTLRKLLQTPGFTVVSVVTLGLGIGANTAIFSLVNGVLLRPLPYTDPDRLVILQHTAPGLDLDEMPQSPATYLRYRDHARLFDGIALFHGRGITLTGDGPPERISALMVSPSLFPILGASQASGRLLSSEDAAPGAPPVVVLSHALFQRRFGGDPDIVGRTLTLDGEPYEVVGILPSGFGFPTPDIEAYLPLAIDPANAPLGSFSSEAIGRLLPDVTLPQAEAELDALIANLPETFPEDDAAGVLANAGLSAMVRPYRDSLIGDVGGVLWLLLGSVGFVLLIACANVANLFLVRTEGRQREVAIRTALGASRGGLLRTFLAESLVLGMAGGGLGLLLAFAGLRLLLQLEPGNIPRLDEVRIDGTVLAFTLGLSLLAGLAFGLAPALRGITPELGAILKEGGRGGTLGRERHRAREVLVASQIALALVLLVACGLMVRSFAALSQVDPGFRPEGVLTFGLFLPGDKYADDMQVAEFHQQLVDRLAALPGVAGAGAISSLPLSDRVSGSGHDFEDHPVPENTPPPILYTKYVTEGYFEAMGIPLLEGRAPTRADYEERRPVVLVSRSVAEHYWPESSPLGRRISPGRVEEGEDNWYTIVGVVQNVRDIRLDRPPRELVYYPMVAKDQEDGWVSRSMSFAVRTTGDPRSLIEAARQEVWAADSDLPIVELQPMTAMVAKAKARWTFSLVLLAIAGAVALLLGSIGIYGVISYVVSQRTSELGIRMAMGAEGGDLTTMILRQSFFVALAGIVPGIVAAALLTRSMSSILYEVSPLDLQTFLVVPPTLLAVALLASWIPAMRAGRLHPVEALRHE